MNEAENIFYSIFVNAFTVFFTHRQKQQQKIDDKAKFIDSLSKSSI